MTPKEKAKELIDIYFKEVSDANPLEDILVSAKKCALICVDEILNLHIPQSGYWTEVKQEINKL
tara:strand:- start:329 stop:520 length:192 start_codon:yes stop_codon:yes gene_type:complete